MPTARPGLAHVVSIVGAAIVLATSGCGADEPPPEIPPRSILWMRVSTSLASEQRVISGVVTAVSETQLAFEVGGSVQTEERPPYFAKVAGSHWNEKRSASRMQVG